MEKENSEIYIEVKGLSKKFCQSLMLTIYYGFLEIILNFFKIKVKRSKLRKGEFWAFDDLNLKLQKGDILGVIGTNGSGKSTLLRILSGIYEPDIGDVYIKGKVVSFLSPGAGFHPHLTVKENIYINGALWGMSKKEIDNIVDSVLKFSELENQVNTPLGILSPGMNMRLSLAIAFQSKPDIYIIDEVLAVGDIKFRERIVEHLKEISSDTIIVLVSHNPELINQVCNKKIIFTKPFIIESVSE